MWPAGCDGPRLRSGSLRTRSIARWRCDLRGVQLVTLLCEVADEHGKRADENRHDIERPTARRVLATTARGEQGQQGGVANQGLRRDLGDQQLAEACRARERH